MEKIVPFLKWAGGKRWLVPELPKLVPEKTGTYFEPFLGSAAIFFSLRPQQAVLSDSNAELIETYSAIASDWEKVLDTLHVYHRKHSEEYYYQVRASKPRLPTTRAARFIYLNRVCWNGLYRVNTRGEFNVPIGTKTSVLLDSDDFGAVAKLLQGKRIVCSDFEVAISEARAGDFIFADPPYTVKHKYNGFVKYNEKLFSWDDQIRLCDALVCASKRGVMVLCTNADHRSIRDLYGKEFRLIEKDRFSSISGNGMARGSYSELLITNI